VQNFVQIRPLGASNELFIYSSLNASGQMDKIVIFLRWGRHIA